jgi:hypothetical protein
MTGPPFTLLVGIPLKPGRADEFMALLNEVFEAMKVEETFVSATALRGAEDPDTILLCENWIDRENSCRCNSNARIEIGTRRDCQSFSAPPPQIVLLRADPLRPMAEKAEFHLGSVMEVGL